ncbi:MAG TPA: hypothetical protein VKB67_02375 [Rhizomicrobium sp.]|nr:hypothetical protein [Rhizomicrobium sp.]
MRALLKEIEPFSVLTHFGRAAGIEGLAFEVTGAVGAVSLGGQARLSLGNGEKISCEVVGLRDGRAPVMPLGPLDGISLGARADFENRPSAGETPTSKGYTPTVCAELPRLLERAGPGCAGHGSNTGLFTVLVEGDDHNEPISDAVRGILDGHVVLDRAIAERGRFPAINVLKSVSRAMPACNSDVEQSLVFRARAPMTLYEDMAELVGVGAYKVGTNPEVDNAVALHPKFEVFLAQKKDEQAGLNESYAALANIPEGRR